MEEFFLGMLVGGMAVMVAVLYKMNQQLNKEKERAWSGKSAKDTATTR